MLEIVLIDNPASGLSELGRALEQREDVRLTRASSAQEALELIGNRPGIHLAVVGEEAGDMSGLRFVEKLMAINAMVNTAVCSPLDQEEFHEQSEGMGILMQLPPQPGAAEAEELLTSLRNIVRLTTPATT